MALTAGIDPQLNAKMHGRKRPETTYKHYYRPDFGVQERAAQMLGAELGRNEGQVGDNMADLLFKKRNTTR